MNDTLQKIAKEDSAPQIISLVTKLASAYLSNHTTSMDDIDLVVQKSYESLMKLSTINSDNEKPAPAVPINESIKEDFLICLEDGKKLKMLKRHLKSTYDLSPSQYRKRWNLAANYPMVAPNYAKKRSSLAIRIGLGKKKMINKAA